MSKLIHSQSSLFFFSYIINAMNNWAFKFIAPLALYAETQSLQMMTVSYGLLFTPNVISPPLVNFIDGKLARKTSLLILNFLGFALCIFGLSYFRYGFDSAVFLIVVFAFCTVLTLFQTLIHGVMKDVIHDKETIESTSRRVAFVDSLFPAIGPLIGSAMLSTFNYSHIFFIIGMVYCLSFILICILRISEQEKEIKESVIAKTTNGFKLIIKIHSLIFCLLDFFFRI
ncbi:MFS transporter [Dickeya sp. CFBP 2040]|uniref:MFS transporter n=1 Tax=Dickeya sp. CFBP 2040 TaxID=2718531 RepID=UPI001448588D|nr:MFS transporter [Dickeya sp. CFBP 2040]NKI75518.1 MFS transporter [Dickeya sp. CFBP 2040]